jgi:hypothetical protein
MGARRRLTDGFGREFHVAGAMLAGALYEIATGHLLALILRLLSFGRNLKFACYV